MRADCPSITNPVLIELLLRAGLIKPEMDLMEMFLIWGRVIRDEQIFKLQLAAPRVGVELTGAMGILRRMNKAELAALKARIGL